MGGVVGKVGQIVEGEAAFAPGETSLLFLRPGPGGRLRRDRPRPGAVPRRGDDPQQPPRIVRSHSVGMLIAPRVASAAGDPRPGSPQKSSTAAPSTTSRKRSPPPGPPRMRTEYRERRLRRVALAVAALAGAVDRPGGVAEPGRRLLPDDDLPPRRPASCAERGARVRQSAIRAPRRTSTRTARR